MSKNTDFINNPTKKNLILFTVLYTISLSLLILSITEVFTVSLWKDSNLSLTIMMLLSTYYLFRLYLNYFKNRKGENNSVSK